MELMMLVAVRNVMIGKHAVGMTPSRRHVLHVRAYEEVAYCDTGPDIQ